MNKKRIIILFVCLGLILITFFMIRKGKSLYVNDYYMIEHPDNWNFNTVDELITIVSLDGNKIGNIMVYPKSEFGSSVSSIISNIYGMHAYLKEEVVVGRKIDDLAYCVVIGYESTAAEQVKNISPMPDELHYIFLLDNKTIVDFSVNNDYADAQVIAVMESVKLKN